MIMTTVDEPRTERWQIAARAGLPWLSPSRGGHQRSHPHQVVYRGGEEELPVHPLAPAMFQLPHPADGFHPAEDFLDALARPLAQAVADVSRRTPVQGV